MLNILLIATYYVVSRWVEWCYKKETVLHGEIGGWIRS